jgi:membrane-bound metal-dependent hydrolase YbcI (DUF457 family)
VYPSEHFLIVAVPLLLYVYARDRRLPSRRLFALGFLASQFPDLIDKPLAHEFGLIPSGRVFMHSFPTVLPLWALVSVYAWRTDRRRAGALFILGHCSHLLADTYRSLLANPPRVPSDLFWPLVPAVQRPLIPRWAGPGSINIHLWALFSTVVLAVTVYYLVQDVRTQLRKQRNLG